MTRRKPLQVSDAEGAWFFVLAGERLGILGELFVGEVALLNATCQLCPDRLSRRALHAHGRGPLSGRYVVLVSFRFVPADETLMSVWHAGALTWRDEVEAT